MLDPYVVWWLCDLNIYTYMKGLLALHNAPHSVIARQMKRAGGYLMVLLVAL